LLEESESSGKEVFGFQTPSKSAGSMAQKAEEERRRGTPQRQPRTPLSKRKTMTPRTPLAQQFTTPNKVRFAPMRGIYICQKQTTFVNYNYLQNGFRSFYT
jgi:hypothetical protein